MIVEKSGNSTGRTFRVAMVAACPLPADRGTPSRIVRMSEALADLGHEIHVVTYHLGTPVLPNGISVHRIPNLPTYRKYSPGPTYQKVFLVDPILCAKLIGVVRKHRIDLIHAHHFEGALVAFGARLVTGCKVIYDAHTTLEGELHHYPTPVPSRAARFLDRYVPMSADHVIAVSRDIGEFVERQGKPVDQITVVPTGVNLEDFDTGGTSDVRTSLGLGEDPVIAYTGGLAAFQGVGYLLAAMKKVIEAEPRARLLIVSADSDVAHLSAEAEALGISGSTKFLTGVPFPKVPPLLASADIAAIPRVGCPGTPQKLGNYMAAGKAIVSFAGAAKLIEHDRTGLIVPDGDVGAFADAIVAMIRDRELSSRLGANAREEIARLYSWPPLALQVQDVYRKVVAEGDRRQ